MLFELERWINSINDEIGVKGTKGLNNEEKKELKEEATKIFQKYFDSHIKKGLKDLFNVLRTPSEEVASKEKKYIFFGIEFTGISKDVEEANENKRNYIQEFNKAYNNLRKELPLKEEKKKKPLMVPE